MSRALSLCCTCWGWRGWGAGNKDFGAPTALPPQPKAARTYITVQRRLVVAQERDLEVRADKPPIDASLARVFLDALQDRAGFAEQLLPWGHQTSPLSPREHPARRQPTLPGLPCRDQHSHPQPSHAYPPTAAAQREADEAEGGPLRSELNAQTPLHTGAPLSPMNPGRFPGGRDDLSYTRKLRSRCFLAWPEQRLHEQHPPERRHKACPPRSPLHWDADRPDPGPGAAARSGAATGVASPWPQACRQLPLLQRLQQDRTQPAPQPRTGGRGRSAVCGKERLPLFLR